ncbi:MAG: hypothetical protein COV67_08415 [Nitrospinae bacterium CG11_big_fil_rev_8_21_14_0_20_56_8]|nr:MAG: hypothetical protein COV67_08415 [Nitrospinae bacterium CG11_big_fil_rev_8_21_14_0_20_56_8]
MKQIDVDEGDEILSEGESGGLGYIINSGEVEIFRTLPNGSKQIITVLKEHDLIGEMSLLDGGPHTATAVALEDCVLTPITQKDFENLFHHKPKGLLHILKIVVSRLRSTLEYAAELEQKLSELEEENEEDEEDADDED